jgi:hypothetical protein
VSATLHLHAIADAAERPVMQAIADELRLLLGPDQIVALDMSEAAAQAPAQAGSVAMISLLGAAQRPDETLADTAERCRALIEELTDQGCAAVFLVTVFHRVARGDTPAEHLAATALRERIRRLNVLAAELSRETGAGVIDIDRIFTLIGGEQVGADYRLDSARARLTAAHAAAWAMLSFGLDELASIEAQERAKLALGAGRHIGRLSARFHEAKA